MPNSWCQGQVSAAKVYFSEREEPLERESTLNVRDKPILNMRRFGGKYFSTGCCRMTSLLEDLTLACHKTVLISAVNFDKTKIAKNRNDIAKSKDYGVSEMEFLRDRLRYMIAQDLTACMRLRKLISLEEAKPLFSALPSQPLFFGKAAKVDVFAFLT
ncbi:hypothetical protein KIL84_002754 [Mauremys mutica]|uniref:Uncharacterized protein n=1 Tax=Mauremys mutica TaxID=74926 RepID=A0A9D3WSR8_9SAUR|nr:hypothetical protein KIL84_002754 [Mauremys mutica]